MPKPNRINVRVGRAHDWVVTMASILTTEDVTVTTSDVYRTLLSEALTARVRGCQPSHRGPIADGCCAHCGRSVE